MYTIVPSRRFKRSFRKLQNSGKLTSGAAADFKIIILAIQAGDRLPITYRDHALAGQFVGYRECHIKGDLLLVYQRDEKNRFVDLVDIGSHSQIFG